MGNIVNKLYNSKSLSIKCLSLILNLKHFLKKYCFLKRSKHWSKEKIERYQLVQLQKLLQHAYQNVPYYHELFESLRLYPQDIKSLSDIEKIPFLTREIIREHVDELKATNFGEHDFEYVTTGGSSGIPLGFYYQSGVSRSIEWAFMKTQWDCVGYHFWDKCIILRGNRSGTSDDGIKYKRALFGRWLVLSPYHLTDDGIPEYIEQIRRFKPKYIQAYPSLITLIAKYMVENHIQPIPTLKAILCGSEGLLPWQRILLKEAFCCPVYTWYGHSEQAVLAGECEVNTDFHIFPEYGYVELIDSKNNVISEAGIMGEIVATSFTNYVFPLIRYRTSDLGRYAQGTCSCGREYKRFSQVDGRLQDMVITSDGRKISLTSLIFAQHFLAFSHISAMQVVQVNPGELIFRIVCNPSYSSSDEAEIVEKIHDVVGSTLSISFEYVGSIPQKTNGKSQFLIQYLDLGGE